MLLPNNALMKLSIATVLLSLPSAAGFIRPVPSASVQLPLNTSPLISRGLLAPSIGGKDRTWIVDNVPYTKTSFALGFENTASGGDDYEDESCPLPDEFLMEIDAGYGLDNTRWVFFLHLLSKYRLALD